MINYNEKMCRDTEKLIKLLSESSDPTNQALIIIASKIDDINNKMDRLEKATEFARWLDINKKSIISVMAGTFILAIFGVTELFIVIKAKLGL